MKLESRIRKAEKQAIQRDKNEWPVIEVNMLSNEQFEVDFARHCARKRLGLIQPDDPEMIFAQKGDELREKYSNLTEKEAMAILKNQERNRENETGNKD